MFWGEVGLVICRWGGLGLGRKRRNGGGDCRQSGHIFTFADGLTDGFYSVGETVGNSDGQSTRHRTDLLFKSLGDSVGIFNGAPVMSPVRIWHFKSVGNSVGIVNGEQVPSRVRAPGFNSVDESVGKITRQNLRATYPPFFH